MKIPKPKYCGQNWLEMSPTDDGRLCGECKKNIVDFSNKSWSEIEKIQRENNNSICGMYSNKQLKYWGQEVPLFSPKKAATATAMVIGLTTGSVLGQTTNHLNTTKERTIVSGSITGKSEDGIIDTLGFSTVYLKNTKIGVAADKSGKYELDITNYIDTIQNPIIVFSMIGYENLEYQIKNRDSKSIKFDPQLSQGDIHVTYFYVEKPTIWKRIGWTFKRWFRRKN